MADSPQPVTPSARLRAARSARFQAGALTGMGLLHVIRPGAFDTLIPPALPGPAQAWTYGSGVAELSVAALLAAPAARRIGGWAAVGLYLAVWPGNVQMAWDARRASPTRRIITLARLPLQLPMIRAGLRVARGA
ncbi:DoxX family protein [Rothia kristinae]|uniref:DoxX family protein n=1 Tax=Rothia kristinae TaxID=37923 RepID=UPI001C930709|nr:hypothetical protein [Rothia kristinae]